MEDAKQVFKSKCSKLLNYDSVRIRVTEERRVNVPGLAVGNDRTECDYTETSIGQRSFIYIMHDASGREIRSEAYCDGEKCVQLEFDGREPTRQKQVNITRGFLNETATGYRDAPEPLRWCWVGLKPISEVIDSAEYLGADSVAGRSVSLFYFSSVPGGSRGSSQDLAYWLDDQTGLPLKVSAFKSGSDHRQGKPAWTWEAVSTQTFDGRLVCTESVHHSSTVESRIRVDQVKFDEPFPASTFETKIQDSVAVFDAVEHRRIGPRDAKSGRTKVVTDPIRADEPARVPWTPIALGIGSALIIAALLLRIRGGRRE